MEASKSKNPSQEKSRALASIQKSTSNFVETCKLPILVIYHSAVTKKLEVIGDKTSVDLARADNSFLARADTLLSGSAASGNPFHFAGIVEAPLASSNHEDPGAASCPLPLLQFQMFGQYKKFKENANLRKSFAAMWRALGFGTKAAKYKDPNSKPSWYDENQFVLWSAFKGSQRPDNFSGNWAYLQYDIMKACYLHYLNTPAEVDKYVVLNAQESSHCLAAHHPPPPPSCLPAFHEPLPSNSYQNNFPVHHQSIQPMAEYGNYPVQQVITVPVPQNLPMINDIDIERLLQDYVPDVGPPENILEEIVPNEGQDLVIDGLDIQVALEAADLPSLPVPNLVLQEETELTAPETDALETTSSETDAATRKRRISEHAESLEEPDLLDLFDGGWLAKLVENTTLEVFGYLQILGTKKITLGQKNATVVKASDGKYITWNVVVDSSKEDEFLSIPIKTVIKVTEATIIQGYRLVIQEYEVINDDIENEICQFEELEFIDKEWYMDTLRRKGMVDSQGARVESHPDYQSTPVRITRSRAVLDKKTRREPAGGFTCNVCDRKFKTEKTLDTHNKRYH